jgi:hypothetical protein
MIIIHKFWEEPHSGSRFGGRREFTLHETGEGEKHMGIGIQQQY